jgi:hypothetical protein
MNEQLMRGSLKNQLTFWTPAKYTELAHLRERLTDVGMNRYCPDARTPASCLREAIEDHYGSGYYVEHLEDGDAFEAVKVARGQDRNVYTHEATYRIDDQGRMAMTPMDVTVGLKVTERYNRHRQLVRAHSVTGALRDMIRAMGGTSPCQGVWWLPQERAVWWRTVADAVEGTRTAGRPTAVYVFNHEIGPDELRAVRDAITREIAQACAEINEGVLTGELKARALASRREQADVLRKRVATFEEILGVSLADVRRLADEADEVAMRAELLLAGA